MEKGKEKWYVSDFIVRVNETPVKTFNTLREASKYVKDMGHTIQFQNDTPQVVDILKRKTNYKVMRVYKPKTVTTFTTDDLGLD